MHDLNPITMKSGMADVPPALAFFIIVLFIMATTGMMFIGGDASGETNTALSALTAVSETCAPAPCQTAV